MAILLSPPDGACWRFNRLFCWEGWPKVVFEWKIEVAPCFCFCFCFQYLIWIPHRTPVRGETFISTRYGQQKFCLKGGSGGQLNVIAGTGHPEQLVTGGHRSSRCIEPLDLDLDLPSPHWFWIWIFIFSTVYFLYCTSTIPSPMLHLPYSYHLPNCTFLILYEFSGAYGNFLIGFR